MRQLMSVLHTTFLSSARIFNARVKDLGLTRGQWELIHLLYEDDGQTQTALATQLIMAKPPLGKMVDRLEAEGWVERRNDPVDRRAKLVYLTQKVEPLIEELEGIIDDIGNIATSGFNKKECETFARLLRLAEINLFKSMKKK